MKSAQQAPALKDVVSLGPPSDQGDLLAAHALFLRRMAAVAARAYPQARSNVPGDFVSFAVFLRLHRLGQAIHSLARAGYVREAQAIARGMVSACADLVFILEAESNARALAYALFSRRQRRRKGTAYKEIGLLKDYDGWDAQKTQEEDKLLAFYKANGHEPASRLGHRDDTWTGLSDRDLIERVGFTAGNLSSATDVGGSTTKFAYDPNHLLFTMIDPNGGTLSNVYDVSARVTQQTDAMSRVTRFTYLPGQTTIVDPNGNTTIEQYQNNELMSKTVGAGTLQAATWTYGYDVSTLGLTYVKDPNGNVSTSSWDSRGNAISHIDGLNRVTTFTYNSANEVLTATDPMGVMTQNAYDSHGNLVRAATPIAGTTQYSVTSYLYDGLRPGDILRMTDATGKAWQYAYDIYGNRTQVIDPLGDKTNFGYDLIGRLTSTVTPKGNVSGGNPSAYTTTATYDAYGNKLTGTDPLGNRNTYTYSANQNLTSTTDANGRVTGYVYDPDNELVQLVRPDGTMLKSVYDGDGHLIKQTDGLQNSTTYQYDALGRRTQMTDPLQRTTVYSYDGAGNMTSVQNPKDISGSYTMTYDAANQLKNLTYQDGITPNVSFVYDLDGQRKSMTTGTQVTNYQYDSAHRLTQTTNGAGAQVGYSYDLQGHLTQIIYPGGAAVNRALDDAGRLVSVTDWANNTTKFAYDANSNIVQQAYPNGVVATFTYDAADQLIQIQDASKSSQLLNLTYSRDNAGHLASENSNRYGHNSLSQMTSSALGSASTTYSYDAGDNLGSITAGSTSSTLTSDAANQLQTFTTFTGSTQTQKYTYLFDANGNRAQRTDQNNGVTGYSYDQANRLVTYGSNATYAYDGDGIRTSKTVSGIVEAFTWDISTGMPVLLADGATRYIYGPGDLPLEQITSSGAINFYHQDQLGSTRALTDSTGTLTNTYSYDPYGNIVNSTGTVINPFQFAGQYVDSESGFEYLRARYYDPATSQFITRDPAVSNTRQPYAYSSDNPLDDSDPSGLCDFGHPFDCAKQAAGWAKAKIVQAAPVLQTIHDVAINVAGACALAAVVIPVSAPVTGTCAASAAIVTVVTGAGLYVAGKEGLVGALWDVATAIPGVGVLRNGFRALAEGRAAARWFSAAERYLYSGSRAAADISWDQYLGRLVAKKGAQAMQGLFDRIGAGFHGFGLGGKMFEQSIIEAC